MSTAWQAAEALLSAAAATAVGTGVALRRPPHRTAWLLVGACLGAFAAGDLLALSTGRTGTIGPVDAVYLAGYPALAAGLHVMHREGDGTRDRAGLVDAAILAMTAGLAGWVFLVGPVIGSATGPERVALLAYLVLDVAVLGVATRLVVGGPTRVVPSLLALGVAALLVTDVVHLRTGVTGRSDLGDPVHAGWVLAALLLAVAAVHPDVRQGVAAAPNRREALSRVRLALLAAVVLIPPALMSLQAARAEYDDIAVLAAGLGVLVALVIARVGLLMGDVAATAVRERTLRTAAAEFVAAGDRPRIHAAALRALDLLVGADVVACRIVDVTALDEVEVVAGGGRHDARVRGRSLAPTLLPYVGAGTAFRSVTLDELDLDVVSGLGLRDVQGQLRVFPVRVHGELLAVVVAIVAKPLEPGTVDAVETLVAQLALALESVTLADDLHVRQSEARFRALVQNSSDAILLLDREASVTYQSSSADRMFGYADDELVGHSVEDLCHPDDLLPVQSGLTEVLSSPGLTRRLELRLRRRGGGWLDAEAAVTNLQDDPNVRATVVTIRDISERKQFEMQLTHQAFHDDLTGLANRALFMDRVAHGLARRERDGTGLAVLLLDLDDFKTVNDGLGHAAGDSMLRAVAERLATLVRPGDTTARLGGDEFAMVLVDLPSERSAVHAVERIISVLGQPLLLEGKEIYAHCSIGIAFAGDDFSGGGGA
ncbi:MAG: diguanylate cyclase, partial [Sporichthyaceae bacterium]